MTAHEPRRARVLDLLGRDAALVLPAAPELRVGRDLELRYRPDTDLFWLTGFAEPGAVAVFCPRWEDAPFTLFVRSRDAEQERWAGTRAGPEAATERFGADAAFAIAELDERLPKMLKDVDTLYFRLGTGRDDVERLVRRVLIGAQRSRQRAGRGPRAVVDTGALLDDLRLIKDAGEIELLRAAARITAEGFSDALQLIRPGAGEWEIEAALEAAFRSRGADGFAFQSIVASGENATVLHYVDNARTLGKDELLLIDAGARYRMYCGDMSRTFPTGGRFTPQQRDVYDIVLRAWHDAIRACTPGNTIADVHAAAVRALLSGLVELDVLDGDVDELVQDEDNWKPYYPHKTSHWIGLDVHDPGDYTRDDQPRRLQPGMVLSVEPGLYIPQSAEDAPRSLRGLAVRTEDTVLITDAEAAVLTEFAR